MSFTMTLPPRVEREVIGYPLIRQIIVDAAVDLLRGPKSLWPVATGFSKNRFQRRGSRGSSLVFNSAPYAKYVELRNNRPARRTLRRNQRSLVTMARRLKAAGLATAARSARTLQERADDALEELKRQRTRRTNPDYAVALNKLFQENLKVKGRPYISKELREARRIIRRVSVGSASKAEILRLEKLLNASRN